MNKSVIYLIRNKINGNIYIGSAVNFHHRFSSHRSSLNTGSHGNGHLQRAWDLYGKDNFEFEILEHVENKENLLKREQFYIDTMNPQYNICRVAGSQMGSVVSEETRKKISLAGKGRKKTEEHKEKIRQSHIGKKRPPLSNMWKKNLSLSVTFTKMKKNFEKIYNESI